VLLLPAPVVLAELRVAVALGMNLSVLDVEELQGHRGLLEFQIHPHRIGQRRLELSAHLAIDRRLQLRFAETGDPFPIEPHLGGAAHHAAHLADAHVQRASDVPVAPPLGPLEPQNLLDLAHGQSLRCHPRLLHRPFGEAAYGSGCCPRTRSASRVEAEVLPLDQAVITMPKRLITIPKSVITIPKRPLITMPKHVITMPK
jgi:hypothetical protein